MSGARAKKWRAGGLALTITIAKLVVEMNPAICKIGESFQAD
ncbi:MULTISPECIES: hypothetical protein [Pseudomonas]|nr:MULTISPECIES: hypothetical protein [Pseudomonas]MDG9855010.1 hypothetical protein [Pseudomonas nitroreducens]MDH1074149.1 hypothetical protein [Pseudomonas nitroreducens]